MNIIKSQIIQIIEENTKYIGCTIILLEKNKINSIFKGVIFENCSFRSKVVSDTFYNYCEFISCNFIELNLLKDNSQYKRCCISYLKVKSLKLLENFNNCHVKKIRTTKINDDDLKYLHKIEGLVSLKLQFDENDIFYLRSKYDGIDISVNRDYHNVTYDVLEFKYKPQEFSGSGLKHLQKFNGIQELFLVKTCMEKESISYIVSLVNLQKLSLGALKNKTNLSRLKDLSNLMYLDLSNLYERRDYCLQDKEIYHIKKLQKLKYLNLGSLNLTTEGFQQLSELTNLQYLNLATNHINNNLKYLPKSIEHLRLITDALDMKDITQFHNLRALDLQVSIHLENCEEITKLPHLQKLCLNIPYMYFENFLLEKLTSLTHLDLSKTNLKDNIINFNGLLNLTHLDLSSTSIHDDHLKYIGKIKTLTHLNLSTTEIEGFGLKYLEHLSSLTHLSLNNTYWLESIESISALTSLTHLNLLDIPITKDYLHHLVKLPIKFLITDLDEDSIKKSLSYLLQLSKLEYFTSGIGTYFFIKSLEEKLPKCKIEESVFRSDYAHIFKWPTVSLKF